ncbi:MAG TPA: ATP-binding protein [Ideonella sp.]|uniref:sensor histidine kinase n=1 Tax=Ideonella sp. TaxID=1929293 RepID=UPI002E358BF4|nr:ATP-binding protein [Ideonella sp.]HEX5685861.1 ATP-binding protein [Ideonella sp.]
MKISTKGKLATAIVLGAIGLIAVMTWWAIGEVERADRQRRQTTEIARALNGLRLVTFEFILHRQARAREQQRDVSNRLDGLLAEFSAGVSAYDRAAAELTKDLQTRNATADRLFAELLASPVGDPSAGMVDPATQRFEAQLSSRLLILQQETMADAFELSELAAQRIDAAQRRVAVVTLAGLALIASCTCGAAWWVNRKMLLPVARLEQATREVAAGNWNYRLETHGEDEIAQMARHFNAMTHALRDSFHQIERSNHELAALNKEIEAFSYSVSHDLRGPLRSMDGFALALLEDYSGKLDEDGEDALHRIRAASQRMGRLIDELLGLSRVTRTELSIRQVDLSHMAQEITEALVRHHPDHAVSLRIDEGMTVLADPALIRIAMQNLLENAWKFTGKTASAAIHVGMRHVDGHREFFVSDNGVGFDMAYAGRLFGAFQRLHHENEFAGTGIGLAIVQRVIRRHGGTISVRAEPGKGATFCFCLPDHAQESEQEAGSLSTQVNSMNPLNGGPVAPAEGASFERV